MIEEKVEAMEKSEQEKLTTLENNMMEKMKERINKE